MCVWQSPVVSPEAGVPSGTFEKLHMPVAPSHVPVWHELPFVHIDELVQATMHAPVLQTPAEPPCPVHAVPSDCSA
jgi:hypothetical protein